MPSSPIPQENYPKAEDFFVKAIAIGEKVCPEHPDHGDWLNNRAELLREQVRSIRNLAGFKARVFRSARLSLNKPHEHRDSEALNTLLQGNYDQVRPLYDRAIAIGEKACPKHPSFASWLGKKALVLFEQARADWRMSIMFHRWSNQVV